MHALLESVARSLESRRLLPKDGRILVAVSGGMDSMVLLHVLHTLAPGLALRLTLAHAHHQLRPRAADADEALVRRVAADMELPVFVERLDVRRRSVETGESLEMAGRHLRHDFLARTAAGLGIPVIALAHHADDQAELILLRLLRGTGGEGLGGMPWRNPSPSNPEIHLIRPLLGFTRSQLRNAAHSAGVPYREDRSNRDTRILRNRIRHQLLPHLERAYAPAIRNLLRRTGSIVGAEAEFVSQWAEKWLAARRREPFHELHPAVQRAVLRLQVRQMGHEPGYERIESLRESEVVQELAPGLRIVRETDGTVRKVDPVSPPPFAKERCQFKLMKAGGAISFDGVRVTYAYRDVGRRAAGFRPGLECFSAAAVGTSIVLRHWLPGDRFQPLGMSRAAKLQDLLTNRRIPREHRRSLAVAATREGEIFWVEGLPPGEQFKMGPGVRRCLLWKWRSGA
ncbi:MAG: tRNA lysidine(34) synthetase TilS [Verrucomicrobiales bacterium]|nr:tRNA lysidine(34) synthetase TilS [Verrucomicrobiales bacterium]